MIAQIEDKSLVQRVLLQLRSQDWSIEKYCAAPRQ